MTAPSPEPLRPDPRGRRLGIIHLVLWTGATAVLLAFVRNNMFDYLDEQKPGVLDVLLLIAGSMLGGASLASLVEFVLRWRSGLPALCQPGHALLLLAAGETCKSIGVHFVSEMIDGTGNIQGWFGVLMLAGQCANLAICLVLLFAVRMERRWRLAFVAFALAHVLFALAWFSILFSEPFFEFMSLMYGPWPMLAGLLFVGAIVAWDVRIGACRDWLHWVGVFVTLGYYVLVLLWTFMILLLHST